MRKVYEKYGTIENVRIMNTKCMFIDFKHTEYAVHAACDVANVTFNGGSVRVDFSSGPKYYKRSEEPTDSNSSEVLLQPR